MAEYSLTDAQLEEIAIQQNIVRSLLNYLDKVDEKAKGIIIKSLEERGVLSYQAGKAKITYDERDKTTADKTKLIKAFGLEAVIEMADVSTEGLKIFLDKSGLSKSLDKYLVKTGSYTVLYKPEIKPEIDEELLRVIGQKLLQEAVATNKKS